MDWPEFNNALDQAKREIVQRFDFKDTGCSLELSDKTLTIVANAEDRVNAAIDVLKEKLVRRKVSLKHLDIGSPLPAPKGASKRIVTIREGIELDKAKQIVKLVKDWGVKAQASIQGDSVRISAKKRDDLQTVMQQLRLADELALDLQFNNFRD